MGHDMAREHSLLLEKCDACPAPAMVTVRLAAGGDVVLCGNHARRHAATLLDRGATIQGDYGWQDRPHARAFVETNPPEPARLPYPEPEWHNPRDDMGWFARFMDRFLKPHEVRGYPRPT